ncbi:hypothetical protein MTR_4g132310 [Medicago truncatula]|uniref:Uncharacterized protein n=1 Tax=Medicago truncatula TaxID=3880 RepID=G7JJ91_MEDTR|nr:hypothetical protein MTR_4g132310 [Medicago truncatula]
MTDDHQPNKLVQFTIEGDIQFEPKTTILMFGSRYEVWKTKCGERGSNTRPSDLQSDALPTELSPQLIYIKGFERGSHLKTFFPLLLEVLPNSGKSLYPLIFFPYSFYPLSFTYSKQILSP